MIATARSEGIPARYVSGYHFVGDLQGGIADFEQASHAWVEAYVPKLGWCSFDPTNYDPVGERYVKLGHGRDYKDIVPVKGVYRGNGEQKLLVTVDVRKVEE
jgi:transglutaminase-like putative cysteine protease